MSETDEPTVVSGSWPDKSPEAIANLLSDYSGDEVVQALSIGRHPDAHSMLADAEAMTHMLWRAMLSNEPGGQPADWIVDHYLSVLGQRLATARRSLLADQSGDAA